VRFAEYLESVSAEALLRGEGGQPWRRRRNDPAFARARDNFEELFLEALDGGWRARGLLREAMTTSDFPLLFGDTLDRLLLGAYQEAPYSWDTMVRRRTVPDFRPVKRFVVDGAEGVLPVVAEQAEYSEAALSEDYYTYQVRKYGRRVPFSWEAMVNDDLDALKDVPLRFGRAVRRTEERFVTELFFDENGPRDPFFSTANGNLVEDNPPLDITSLQAAFALLAAQRDADGEPIALEMVTLVVPPALEIVAQNILNATQLQIGDTTSNAPVLMTANWIRNRVRLAVNSYIPLIVTSGDNGSTSWALFASPTAGRPAGEIGFLRGYETPDIRIKASDSLRVGGGGVDPMDGDFDTDSIQYRVRHVFGGVAMDPKSVVGSNGSGS
jgi:hypothetical protein